VAGEQPLADQEGADHADDGGDQPFGDAQAVAVEDPLDGEGDGHDQHGRATDEGGDPAEQGHERGALRDVHLQAVQRLLGDQGEQDHRAEREQGGQQSQQVGGAAQALREQRLDDVDVRVSAR
jgi:hypothetical protein